MRCLAPRLNFTDLLRGGTFLFLLLCVPASPTFAVAEPPEFDILIQNGTIIDGTGKQGFQGDVGISGRRIVAIGKLGGAPAKQKIDATGLVVCPGFIDLHSHADRGILKFRAAENYIRQGVTTLVCGNCGSSPVDIGKFFLDLREQGSGPNIAMLIGHGSVRQQVIGRLNVPPNDKQLPEMKRLVRQAMKDGAVGMSTSLRYGPGTYATTEEIVALAKEIEPFGGFYATHMRDEGTQILDAIEEALLIGTQAKVPVHISHHKISSASVFGLTRLTLDRIERARASGMDVTLDQYPYGAGSGSLNLYVPQASLSGGMDAYRKRVADPKQRSQIAAEVKKLLLRKLYEAGQSADIPEHTAIALARIQIARATHDETIEGKNLVEILESKTKDVTLSNAAELLIDLVSQNVGGINHTLDARPGGDVDRVMQHPLTCVASDGSVFQFGDGHPHPRSYGCYPRVLGHYVREREVLTLEQAIHKMSALPAQRLRLPDRGHIKKNYWADLVVFDPKKISDRATFVEPHRHSQGVQHVLVRGKFVLKSGKMTGDLPGGPLP